MQRQRNALVTGSTSGIGLAIATELAARGMNIVLNGFGDPAEIETLRQRIAETHGVDVLFDGADMSRQGEIETMLARAAERFGGIDVLVNNAASSTSRPSTSFRSTSGMTSWRSTSRPHSTPPASRCRT